ncbi:hypothetical protein TVAG_094790 [Trichomonas vaginalis G3]|uniref:RSE1/DDB1/CPSF1 second beta-propeller domain-containing protein n=1 Tax=Trichomonas vaginalis (strain ATCC PRA-98 / G3) TaxID=412133 RepID=A2FWA8_TRIV3|nr:DNA repair/RNA processing CPSF family [Trichomonas vaginalis G3]EAX90810.1 hypothetical protein TVAG_094790 [Trichomonas vaginalis G3]KAI5548782.1 DNA repair/RNA processing CPSF family [Trichomonas vaginalis G3]|eukprot:XP_001303740.1 hypothetical protein [Trichomonas vaginalis G3]
MSNDSLIFVHKALQDDQQVTRLVAIRNSDGDCLLLVMAQGNTMNLIDPKSFEITEKYPFMSPIVGLEALETESPSVFVLLRNLHWYIFQLPELIAAGSFHTPNLVKDRRFLLPVENYAENGSTCQNPISTAAIRFIENKIPIAIHPQYIAVHIVHNCIHIIPIKQPNNIIILKINYPNIVDIAFIGPVNYSTRLAILCDPEFSRKDYGDEKVAKQRVFVVYSLQRGTTEFKQEFSLDVKPDSHTILPLSPARESSAIVFTLDGVIRITAPEGLNQDVEHITLFLEGLVLLCEHYSEDIYFLGDSNGGLVVALLPTEGRPSSLKLKYTGPLSSIVTIDKSHFSVSNTFGDTTFFYAEFGDNVRKIEPIKTIEATGTVRSLTTLQSGDVRMLAGRGIAAKMMTFHMSMECEKICSFNLDGCLSVFLSSLVSDKDQFLLVMSFLDRTMICQTDGLSFKPITVDGFIENEPTILFTDIDNSKLIQVTSKHVSLFTKEKVTIQLEFEGISCASCVENNLLVCDTSNTVVQFEITDRINEIKKFTINDPILFCSISENGNIALITTRCEVLLYMANSDSPLHFSPLEIDRESPSSLIVLDKENKTELYIGTYDGNLIKVTKDSKTSEKVGDTFVKLTLYKNTIYGSTTTPFLLTKDEILTSIGCDECTEISVCKDIIVTLHNNKLQTFRCNGGRRGYSKLDFTSPDAVDAKFFSPSKCVVLEDVIDKTIQTAKENLTLYKNGKKVLSLPSETGRVSLFDMIELNGKSLIILGLDNCSIRLFDESMSECCIPQKTSGIPTAAIVCNSMLVVAEGKQLSLYNPQFLHTTIELDRVCLIPAHVLATSMDVCNDYLIVGDAIKSISVYKITNDSITLVGGDPQCKGICRVCCFRNFIFASTYNSCLYLFEMNEKGEVNEISGIMTDSMVSVIKSDSKGLIYGTECGGVYRVDFCESNVLLKLRDIFENEKINFCARRNIENRVRFDVEDPFVDLDNIAILGRLQQQKFENLLESAGCSKEEYNNLISNL